MGQVSCPLVLTPAAAHSPKVLVAYVSQGAAILSRLFPAVPNPLAGLAFLGTLSFALYALDDKQVDAM
jgi:hypothetical protein